MSKKKKELTKEEIKKILDSFPKKFRFLEENIGLGTQMEYMNMHHQVNIESDKGKAVKMLEDLLRNGKKMTAEKKKKLLLVLGHQAEVDVFEGIKEFIEKEISTDVKQFAILAMRECEMNIRNDLLNEKEGMIITPDFEKANSGMLFTGMRLGD